MQKDAKCFALKPMRVVHQRIKKRRQYELLTKLGWKVVTPGFVLLAVEQAKQKDKFLTDYPRAGFTVTKKIGNAVVRNRLRRRLKALVFSMLNDCGMAGMDYVFIGRAAGVVRDSRLMEREMKKAFAEVNAHFKRFKTMPFSGCPASGNKKEPSGTSADRQDTCVSVFEKESDKAVFQKE